MAYPITETLFIGDEIYVVVAPVIIGDEHSTNWLGEPLYHAEKVTSGKGKQFVAITESWLEH